MVPVFFSGFNGRMTAANAAGNVGHRRRFNGPPPMPQKLLVVTHRPLRICYGDGNDDDDDDENDDQNGFFCRQRNGQPPRPRPTTPNAAKWIEWKRKHIEMDKKSHSPLRCCWSVSHITSINKISPQSRCCRCCWLPLLNLVIYFKGIMR